MLFETLQPVFGEGEVNEVQDCVAEVAYLPRSAVPQFS